MLPNPLVRLYADPVPTLTALAYALVLLAVSVALAGLAYRGGLRLYLMVEHRHTAQKFGPQWRYVPPLAAFGYVAGLCLLVAVEALLWAALVYLVA